MLIEKKFLIINIDETSFSNSTCKNYSWISKAGGQFISSSMANGFCTLTSSIDSQGSTLSLYNSGTNKSEEFILFLTQELLLY